jgi:hypothetical protein
LRRSKPWSTNTQVSWSPIASWIRIAATELSTPPDRPQITLPEPTLLADLGHLGFAIGGHRPVALQPAHAMDKVGDQLGAVRRVRHFGMELRAVELTLLVGDHCERRAVADSDDVEARREGSDLVAVAHPHLVPFADGPKPVKQRTFLGDGNEGATELAFPFALVARLDPSAQLVAHHLLPVTDAEDGKAGFEQLLRRPRAAFLRHAGGRARQDDARRASSAHRRRGLG